MTATDRERVGYSAQQVRDAEAPHLAAGEPLMARAASALAAVVRETLARRDTSDAGRVLLLVGSGNNGGDALFAGAELAAQGVAVTVVKLASHVHAQGLESALAAGVRPLADPSPDTVAAAAGRADVVVDGILGTGAGADPALRGRAREAVLAILPVLTGPRAPAVVAVDIPSGIGPDDGSVPDAAVLPALVTVTFGGYKAGLLRGAAVMLAGEVLLVDIGIADDLARFMPVVRVPVSATAPRAPRPDARSLG